MASSRQTPTDPEAIIASAQAEIDGVIERARRDVSALTEVPATISPEILTAASDRLDELAGTAQARLQAIADGSTPALEDREALTGGASASREAGAALRRELAVWEEERRPQPASSGVEQSHTTRPAWPPSPAAKPRTSRRAAVVAILALVTLLGTGAAFWFNETRLSLESDTPGTPAPATTRIPAPAAAPTQVPAEPPAAPLIVRWETQRPSWIRTTVDGVTDEGALYEAGESRSLEASGEIRLRVGDAGAVLVSVNNGPPVTLGDDGQVVNRRFTAAP